MKSADGYRPRCELMGFRRNRDVNHRIAEIRCEHRPQIVADPSLGFIETCGLRDAAPTAEPLTLDEQVPAAGPLLDVHDEASGRLVPIREGARIEHVLNLGQKSTTEGWNGEISWTVVPGPVGRNGPERGMGKASRKVQGRD